MPRTRTPPTQIIVILLAPCQRDERRHVNFHVPYSAKLTRPVAPGIAGGRARR